MSIPALPELIVVNLKVCFYFRGVLALRSTIDVPKIF